MSELQERFAQAAIDVKKLPSKPSNQVLLKLYSLYKQGSEGDVTGRRPGMLDLKGGAKYDAWKRIKGTSTEDAMESYIQLVENLSQ